MVVSSKGLVVFTVAWVLSVYPVFSFVSSTRTLGRLTKVILLPKGSFPEGSRHRSSPFSSQTSSKPNNSLDPEQSLESNNDDNSDKTIITRGSQEDEMPESFWQEIVEGQPSEWNVMKELLGINVLTYILAAAIAFFLSMNTILGPGWLGNSIGIKGTGTFTERSEKLPDVVDLSEDRFQIL